MFVNTRTIVIFVRASDNRLIIKPWHCQLRVDYAVTGTRQVTMNGVSQPNSSFNHSVWEWQFPRIEAGDSDANVSGSTQSVADGGDAELAHHHDGGMPSMAVCRWAFTKGSGTPTDIGQTGGAPSTSIPPGTQPGSTGLQNNGQSCQSPARFAQAIACILDEASPGAVKTVVLNGFPFERVR